MNHKDSVSILSLLKPLVKQILEDMREEEKRIYTDTIGKEITNKMIKTKEK